MKPGQLSAAESELRAVFLAEVDRIPGGDRLRRCIQCGTCSGSCPVSREMDLQPRELVAYFRAGDLARILRSRTIRLCASCYACSVRCPAGIKVTDLIYALKRMALERRIKVRGLPIDVLADEFARGVRRYGRSHEPTLVGRFLLRAGPWRLPGLVPLAWKLLRTGRLEWRPQRIKDLAGLRGIIARAERMDQDYVRDAPRFAGRVGYGAVAEQAPAGRVA